MKPNDVHKTIGKFMLADGDEVVVDLEKSHGVYMHDAITGEEYLDFFSYFASQPIGHNHPKMRDPWDRKSPYTVVSCLSETTKQARISSS